MLEKYPDVYIISDEIYERLIYTDVEHLSFGAIPEIADRVITINGLSKAFAMTGWRIGYTCAPGNDGAVAKAMNTLQSQINTSITSFTFAAIPVALGLIEEVESMRQVFAKRASLMHELISKWPYVDCPKPTGAFYAFPKVSHYYGKTSPGGTPITDAVSFATALLAEASVAVVPGTDFCGCGDEHVRLSFACSEENITEGVNAVCEWLSKFD